MKHLSIVAGWILSLVFALGAPLTASAEQPGDSPSADMDYQTPEAKRIIARFESGEGDAARKELTKLLRGKSANPELWMIEALVLVGEGDYDGALFALEKARRGGNVDLPVFLTQAKIHEDRAQLGPGGTRKGGMVSYKASGLQETAEHREKFVTDEKRCAAEAYAEALKIHPGVRAYQVKYVALLREAGDAKTALAAANAYAQKNPGEAALWLEVAKAAVVEAAWPEARAAVERCLALHGSMADACRVMAEIETHEGNTDAAREWDRQARFHALVPAFLRVEYTPENFAKIEPLLVYRAEVPEDQQKAAQARAVAAIDALIAEKSDTSSRLLGVIAWGHDWHGEVEDRIYAELEARKEEAVLMTLFDRANSYCTVGSAAPALARLNSEVAFPLILDRLPADQNMYSMNLPEALAIYGRPEAVPALGKAMEDAIKVHARAGKSVDVMIGSMGMRSFIERCIWALATFKSPEARGYLEKAARQKDFEADAVAALFKQTGEQAFFQRLLKLLKADPGSAEWIARRYEEAALPEAAAVEKIAQQHEAAKKKAKAKAKK